MLNSQAYQRTHIVSQLITAGWLEEFESPGFLNQTKKVIEAYREQHRIPNPASEQPAERFFRWPILPLIHQYSIQFPSEQREHIQKELLLELSEQFSQAEQNPKKNLPQS
jgi:hypothetical protein